MPRIDVTATSIVKTAIPTLQFPGTLLDDVMSTLDVPDGQRQAVARGLHWLLSNYLMWSSLPGAQAEPSTRRAIIKEIATGADSLLVSLRKLHPIQAIGLNEVMDLASPETPKSPSLIALNLALESLKIAATEMFENGEVMRHRPRNLLFEKTIEALMAVLENATGNKATVRTTKAGVTCYESTSPEAEAIIILFRAADANVNEITIINKINEIRKRHRDSAIRSELADYALWLPGATIIPC